MEAERKQFEQCRGFGASVFAISSNGSAWAGLEAARLAATRARGLTPRSRAGPSHVVVVDQTNAKGGNLLFELIFRSPQQQEKLSRCACSFALKE